MEVTLPALIHCTTEQGEIFPPVTVKVTAAPPTAAAVCESDAIVGAGRPEAGVVKVNCVADEVPAELETVTPAAPANAVSVGKMAAVSCVALTKVVTRGDPFQLITDPLVKLDPFTVKVKPAAAQYPVEDGVIDEMAGPGAPGLLMRNGITLETSVVLVA